MTRGHLGDRPIGVFDSGVGGLTVARALLDQLPAEQLLYIGDTANGPYGPLPIGEVRGHALAGMDQLVAMGVKMLVIACNSASSACLRDARERYDVPVLEVIQPAVRRAVVATRNGRIGLLATHVTVASRAYDDAFAAAAHVTLFSAACPRFVDFVERGVTTGDELVNVARSYLAPLLRVDVDTLVLGCTHYPLLTGLLRFVVGDRITLVSSAEETAKDVYRVLVQEGIARHPEGISSPSRFLTTGDPEAFSHLVRRFLAPEIWHVDAVPSESCVRVTTAPLAADSALRG